ncbi:membrane protein [Bacillus sp. SA1-12]|uniref:DMT family transporter n=1 Tax=Bacillus sp. SA1-12 TaxID=1455638 RepID=UPI0006271B1F|nr:DMT family transporter [Bacillus sp. SA1-12]KKI89023.1 membrane protein [Bacillus sp. SA1-12]
MKSTQVYYIGLILVAVIWGVNFGISRFAMEVFSPEIFVFLRFGLALPILFGILKWTEGSVKVEKRDLIKLAIIGFFGVTLLEILVMYSIKYTTLANASLLNVAPWPIFAALFASFFTKEVMTPRLVIGGLVALVGVVLIILGGEDGFDFSSQYMLGNMLALAISFIGALYNLSCMPLMAKYSPLRVSAWCILFGSIFLMPVTIGGWQEIQWNEFTIGVWGAIAYNVLLCTVAAFVIWNVSMNKVGAAKSNFYRYFVPASATVTGSFFFNEPILITQIIGGIVIIFGLAWIATERKQIPVQVSESIK